MTESKLETAARRIRQSLEQALADGLRVHLGGDPAVLQVASPDGCILLRTVWAPGSRLIVQQSPIGKALPATLAAATHAGKPGSTPPPAEHGSVAGAVAPDMLEAAKLAARSQGYSGELCHKCGSARMRMAGTCAVCEDCGTTGGCS